jgi:hypothetical protein
MDMFAILQAKAFFPPKDAITVWHRLHPHLSQPLSPLCLEALTSLLIFFPHHGVSAARTLPWNEWAFRSVEIWRTTAHNVFWDSAWICFLSRLAKHDTHVRATHLPYYTIFY